VHKHKLHILKPQIRATPVDPHVDIRISEANSAAAVRNGTANSQGKKFGSSNPPITRMKLFRRSISSWE